MHAPECRHVFFSGRAFSVTTFTRRYVFLVEYVFGSRLLPVDFFFILARHFRWTLLKVVFFSGGTFLLPDIQRNMFIWSRISVGHQFFSGRVFSLAKFEKAGVFFLTHARDRPRLPPSVFWWRMAGGSP